MPKYLGVVIDGQTGEILDYPGEVVDFDEIEVLYDPASDLFTARVPLPIPVKIINAFPPEPVNSRFSRWG